MKSKTTFAVTALALALACSQAANGSVLLLGWHSFDGIASTPETPDYALPGVSGSLIIEGTGSRNTGGSNDGGYGNSPFPAAQDLPSDDGHARLRPRIPSADGFLQIRVTNNLSFSAQLDDLFFDMADALENVRVEIYYGSTLGVPAAGPDGDLIGTAVTGVSQTSGESEDFGDFGFTLDRQLAGGQSSFITFWIPSGQPQFSLRLDNIGVGGIIPEPGSLLGLGGVIGAGLLIRRRQRQ